MTPGEIENLLARLERLEADLVGLRREMAVKDGVIIDQLDRIARLEAALEEARRGGKRQAAPFAKGDPEANPKRPGRKRGDGHGRHGHRMAPVGPADRELDAALPGCCPDCGGVVVGDRVEPQWQVDLPAAPAPTVTRFNVAVGHCGGCGRRVQGRHPEQISQALGAAGSSVGPGAKALAAWLHYGLGLSFAKTAAVVARFGIDLTAGAIAQAAATSASRELGPVHAELVTTANRSATLTLDETGWRVGGRGAWLWVATNAGLTLYWVTPGRSFADASERIAADYPGIIVRDGWIVYERYDQAAHQTCLAHLARRARDLEGDLDGADRRIPRAVNGLIGDALAARDLDPAGRAAAAVDLAARLGRLVARPTSNDANRRLLAHLARQAPAMFTFLTAPADLALDATNWRAETGIRPAVVNRKTWGGNRTWNGARTQSVITSVLRTATQHGHDAIAYLADRARAPDPGLTILLG